MSQLNVTIEEKIVEIDVSIDKKSAVINSTTTSKSVEILASKVTAPGLPGPPGSNGLSAYQVWLSEGNSGTEQDYLDSLIGPNGVDGNQIKGFRDVAGTTDTLLASDAGWVIRYSNASDITITVDDLLHAEKDVITLLPEGIGTLIVTAGAGVTINPPDDDPLANKSPGVNKPIQLLFHAVNNATLIGTVT